MSALLPGPHSQPSQQIDGEDASANRDLRARQPLVDEEHRNHDQQHNDDEDEICADAVENAFAERDDDRRRLTQGGVNRGEDDGKREPEPAFPFGAEERTYIFTRSRNDTE